MEPLTPEDPERVGDHRLLARLGAGGMGVVYLGRSPGGRRVAVKVVRQRFAADAEYRARFRREVTVARTVTGAFTAPVLDADPAALAPWLVTAYLPGLTLREAIGTFGALPQPAVLVLAAGLAEALADLHRAGLAHRDLKPGNVMLTSDGPRVIDFGIARPADATAITLVGAVLGTPGFMSPEQVTGHPAGPPSDIFSLGAVLAFAATGREPFGGGDTSTTLHRVEAAEADLTGITDRTLADLLAACLRREPQRRPSAATLLDGLDANTVPLPGAAWLPPQVAGAIEGRTAHARDLPAGVPMRSAGPGVMADVTLDPSIVAPPKPARRIGRRALIAGAAGLVAGGGAAAFVLSRDRDAPPADRASGPATTTTARPTTTTPATTTSTPPPVATVSWRAKVSDFYPERVFAAGDVVVAQTEVGAHALDARTGRTLWKQEAGNGVELVGGTVYLSRPIMPWLTAADPATGATRWQVSYREDSSNLTRAGSLLCFGGQNGIRAVEAANGRSRWTSDVKVSQGAGIAADAHVVVAVTETHVVALDAGSGRTRWTYRLSLGDHLLGVLVVSDGRVIVTDRNGTLWAHRADTGAVLWRRQKDSTWNNGSGLLPSGGSLYGDNGLGSVVAVRADTGEHRWSMYLRADCKVTLGNSLIYASCPYEKDVYAIDPADGSIRWAYHADIAQQYPPAATAGLAFVGTKAGNVEAIEPPVWAHSAGS